jgi:hypothetical protein
MDVFAFSKQRLCQGARYAVWLYLAIFSPFYILKQQLDMPTKGLSYIPRLYHSFILGVEPLKRIVLAKDGSIDPVAVVFEDFLSMYAVQTVFPLIKATAVGAIFR